MPVRAEVKFGQVDFALSFSPVKGGISDPLFSVAEELVSDRFVGQLRPELTRSIHPVQHELNLFLREDRRVDLPPNRFG
jgi:hypothetical protein